MDQYFSDTALINTQPVKRAAYSDRTAWVMAEISRLVYEKLPGEVSITDMVKQLREGIKTGDYETLLDGLEARLNKQGISVQSEVVDELKKANFDFVDSFAINGTEAIIAKLEPHPGFPGMLVLAFRGTEISLDDIRADLKADLVNAPGYGRVHSGFLRAFEQVSDEIKTTLAKHEGIPIYITGHSLGGALALVATRYLCPDSIGATYTFGCPRVGDTEFFRGIRTPVYRVVNAADGVTRLPFGQGFSLFLSLIRIIPINGTKVISEWLREKIYGYTHYGNLVFLSSSKNVLGEDGVIQEKLELRNSPNIFWTAKVTVARLIETRGSAAASDHSISDYSRLLLTYARQRNKGVQRVDIAGSNVQQVSEKTFEQQKTESDKA